MLEDIVSREEIELPSSVARKFSNVLLGTEKFGSNCRNLRSARIIASWSADDGSIDTSAPRGLAIINFYSVHSVKANGEFRQHAFAAVWWYKTDCDQGHLVNQPRFGNGVIINPVDLPYLCQCSA